MARNLLQELEPVAVESGHTSESGLVASSQQVTGTIQELATAARELARISAELKEIATSYKV
ncbi:hypothetical protein [Desulfofundulus thermocisternus]|uniref:hypothetical protein n=1 Tax=Desulfofundulus thermocisternus TaxID=42471 RepID=UPI000482329B|nr:hypothetical protein [Desulfofundulus thermocisternus]